MPRCIIDNCSSVYDSIKERRQNFFNAPKDQTALKLWQKVINRPNFVVKPHHVVCEKHFRKEDIMWRREIKDQNGVVIGVSPYKLPRLRKGVVPSLHISTTKEKDFQTKDHDSFSIFAISNVKENERPNSRDSLTENVTITIQPDLSYVNIMSESTRSETESVEDSHKSINDEVEILPSDSDSRQFNLEDIANNESLKVPASWIKYSISNQNESFLVFNENICKTMENGLKTVVLKEIIVDEQLCIHVNVLNQRVDTKELRCVNKLNNIDDLQSVVNLVFKLDICKGYCTSKNIDYTAVYVDPLNTYRHIRCLLLVANKSRCQFCHE